MTEMLRPLLGAVLFGFGVTTASATSKKDLLDEIQRVAPAGENITLPSPNPTVTVPNEVGNGAPEGSNALRNLREERTLQIQQDILDRLPDQ